MKKIRLITILFVAFFLTIPTVKAANITTTANTVYPGQSFTASVTINAAAWNVHSSTLGPVSGCIMNDVNASDTAMNITKTISVSCTAIETGTITITLSGDYTTQDGNNIPLTGSKTVQVVQRPQPQPQPQTPTYRPPVQQQPQTPKSSNNYLKSLKVEGCTISPEFNKDKLEYSCKDLLIDKIEIKAEVEDSKSTITGTGSKELFNGDNNFEVKVTSEDGQIRVYKLLINKKNIPSTKILKLKIGDKEYKVDEEIILYGLPPKTEKIDLKVTTDSTTAKVNITGNENLKPGYNIINISVTDTDCVEKIYKVLIYIREYDLLENKNTDSLDKDYIVNLNKNAAYLLNKSILNNVDSKKLIYHIIDSNNGILSSMEITNRQQLENDYELYFITKNNKVYTNIFEKTKVKTYFGNKFNIGDKLYIYAYNEETQAYELLDTQEYKDYYVSFETTNSFEYLITTKEIKIEVIKEKKTKLSEIMFVVIFQVIVMGTIIALISNRIKSKYENNKEEKTEEKTEEPVLTPIVEEKIEEKPKETEKEEKETTIKEEKAEEKPEQKENNEVI